MARLRLRSAAPLFLLASPTLALKSDFSFYPQNAQSCLTQAADTANCQGASAAEINTCLCGNGGDFVTNTAKCLGQDDQADLQKVYTTMLQACTDSKTPLSVSQSDFIAAANGDTASTTKAPAKPTATSAVVQVTTTTGGVTVTVTSQPTETGAADNSTDKQGGGGLPTGATIGIAVGASIAGVGALAALVFFLVRRRKGRAQEEAHPMLSPHEYNHPTPTTFPPTEPSPDYSHYSGAESKSGAWPPPYQSPETYAGPFAPPPPVHIGVAELQSPIHYEMDGTSAPQGVAEMPGSEPPVKYHSRT